MPQGRSIHIGLNHVDPAAYGGWAGTLKACEFDARDMCDLATSRGFQTYQLLTTQATSRALFNALDDAAAALAPGDFLFLTYSGHGGQVPDSNGDEEDGLDETWVLYDRQVIDDELYGAWAKFQPGVRIFVLSDSCHSGTVDRMMEFAQIRATQLLAMSAGAAGGSHPSTRDIVAGFAESLPAEVPFLESNLFGDAKVMPYDVQRAYYRDHKAELVAAEMAVPAGSKTTVGASVILISGCQDKQTSADGPRNGVFTGCFRKVWAAGGFNTYTALHAAIVAGMPSWQTPNLDTAGASNPAFLGESPLSI